MSKKHTTAGIRWSSPTQLLIRPSLAYLWESGRDPEFSSGYGRMYQFFTISGIYRPGLQPTLYTNFISTLTTAPALNPQLLLIRIF